ncbi:MAG: YkgJ family cysteine cluster protein [Candidatus Lokiarchaeota archaeon]|nr:YkgJ family cysteine cluster protein [Candidatus Lokiarchaeota archaeon]
MEQSSAQMLELIRKYNILMRDSISGPNCIDPSICHADCCHIMIDVPKFLAEHYIGQNIAEKEDFRRGDLFSFKINISTSNSKCVFYDVTTNGCKLHSTLIKPPQCWIYPTGFSNQPSEEKKFADDGTITCKVASRWKITDTTKTSQAKILFNHYVQFCETEFASENTKEKIRIRLEPVFDLLKILPPKTIAGVIDGWDHFTVLQSEGISLKLKTLCDQLSRDKCNYEYIECTHVCNEIIEILHRNLLEDILNFVKINGPKHSYSFLELWNMR